MIGNEWKWKNKSNKGLERFNLKKGNDEMFHGDMMLDKMKSYVKQMIEKAIEKHVADGLGTIDHATMGSRGTLSPTNCKMGFTCLL